MPWTRFAASVERDLERKGKAGISRLGELRSARGAAAGVEPEEEAVPPDENGTRPPTVEESIGAPVTIVKSPDEPVAKKPAAPRRAGARALPVRLKYFRPDARQVSVVGSFNHWDPTAHPLAVDAKGEWAIELKLPPGRFEYRFLADGIWCDDPAAVEHVANPHGTRNAVLQVSG
ncbi:MAG TPA: isoamylase early set domain-containing protein [Verrucomicrobiae bacterium]|nr:isoamylase early set domain-containing protein [Verrucomicrobiae bacterium]